MQRILFGQSVETKGLWMLRPRWDIYRNPNPRPREHKNIRVGSAQDSEDGKEGCEILSFLHDLMVILMITWKRPTRCQANFSIDGKGSCGPTPNWEPGNWWLLKEGESLFLRGVATGRLAMRLWIAPYPLTMCMILNGLSGIKGKKKSYGNWRKNVLIGASSRGVGRGKLGRYDQNTLYTHVKLSKNELKIWQYFKKHVSRWSATS